MKRTLICLLIAAFVFSCSNQAPYHKDPIPDHDSLRIFSKNVNEERVINVWMPQSYVKSNDSLPVLYMADGGVKEDFPHIANTLSKLISEKKIPPHMLVGIENTNRGRDLTGPSDVKEHEKYNVPMTDGAKHFRAFIVEELMPLIDSSYRTTKIKGIIGESASGLFVMETFFLQPNAFDFYVAMDPSFWWNGNYLVNNAEKFLANLPDKQTKVWFAGSDATDIKPYTDQLGELLKNKPFDNLVWKYSPEPNEKHNTIFRATKEKALTWVMNGN